MLMLNNPEKQKRTSFNENKYKKQYQSFWKKHDMVNFISWELNKSQTTSLVVRCREERVSVNTAICTAFLAAQREVLSKKPYHDFLYLPAQFRTRLSPPIGEVCAPYAASFLYLLKYNPRKDFWKNSRRLQKILKRRLTDKSVLTYMRESTFVSQAILEGLSAGSLTMDMINNSYTLSNLGRFDFPVKYGSLQLESVFSPAVFGTMSEKVLTAITVGGRLSLTLVFEESIIDSPTMEKIKDAAMKYLLLIAE